MRKKIITLLAAIMVALGFGFVIASPAHAVYCQYKTHSSSTVPPPFMTWHDSTQAWRSRHYYTSRDCFGTFTYWSHGIAHDGASRATVRLIYYNSMHHWERATPWRTVSGGGSLVFVVPRGSEIAWECADFDANDRHLHEWCLFEARF